jgi:topoisomerase (DNA) II binding protein 1
LKIYSENFNDPAINEKIKKFINQGGAIRFDEFNSDVTHLISNGHTNELKFKSYIESNPELNIISIDWFINSCKSNQLSDCATYIVFNNALNSVKTPKKRPRPNKSMNQTTNTTITSKSYDSDLNDYLSQYLNVEAAVMKAPPQPQPQPQSELSFKIKKEKVEDDDNDDETMNDADSTYDKREPIFANKYINMLGFDEDEAAALAPYLLKNGANLLPFDPNQTESSFSHKYDKIDYTIFPITVPKATSFRNPVTVYWVKSCIREERLIPPEEKALYQPIPKYNDSKPLVDFVITPSGFILEEKQIIYSLGKTLGAHVQASLSVKTSGEVFRNTHLISKQASGPKYNVIKNKTKIEKYKKKK